MSNPLSEPSFTLRFEPAIEGNDRVTMIYPTLRRPDTYQSQGYKFWAVLQDPFCFQLAVRTWSLKMMIRGIPVGEARPVTGRNGNVYVPTRPARCELASTIRNLVIRHVGYLPLTFCGDRKVRARFAFFYPGGINRNRIADTDNLTKFVKDAIEMVGIVSNDAQINDEHAVRVEAGGREEGESYIKETGGIIIVLEHDLVAEDDIEID